MKLHWQILIALVLGVLAGIFIPQAVPYIAWVGTIFMKALGMIVVPLILFSIVSGLLNIQGNQASLKRIGLRTMGCYVMTMLIAIITGLLLVNLIRPGDGVEIVLGETPENLVTELSVTETLTNIVPSNIFAALSSNNTLSVIFLALLIGIFLPQIGREHQGLFRSFFQGGTELMIKITNFIIKLSPYGVFAIIAGQISRSDDVGGLLQTMLMYVVTVFIGLALQMFVWLPLLLRFGFGVRPGLHFKNMSVPLLTAFSTASSNATLPLSMDAVSNKDGVSKNITGLTLPLGATINMDGTALLECVGVLYIAQAYGIDLSFSQQIIVASTALLAAMGTAGIPMAALVMMVVVLKAVGLPLEGIGLVIGVDRILDMGRTAVNVYGDTCVAVMVAKMEKEKLPIDR